MKLPNKKNHFKKNALIVGGILFVLLAGITIFYVYYNPNNNSSDDTKNQNTPSADQVKEGNVIKENSIDNSPETVNPKQNTPAPSAEPDKQTSSITITALNQNSGVLQIRTLISVLDSSGTCTLTLTKASTSIVKSSGVQATSNSSTCEGFDVPVSELSTGDWNVKVDFKSQTTTASTESQVTIK